MPEELDSESIKQVKDSEETWVIDFWAEWCGPCKKLSPIFNEVSEEVDSVKFGKVDMQENQQLGTQFGVRALPTLLIVKNGEEVARSSGVMKKEELKTWIVENS